MQITERLANLLTRFKHGDQQVFVTEYLGPLLLEVRESQDSARETNDMLRYQGQVRLLKQILKDIETSDTVLNKLENQRRKHK